MLYPHYLRRNFTKLNTPNYDEFVGPKNITKHLLRRYLEPYNAGLLT